MKHTLNTFSLQFPLPTKLSVPVAILVTFFMGCVKTASKDAKSTEQILISQSRAFFNNNILPLSNTPNVNNYRACQPKTINWDLATVLHISTGDAVIVPITFRNHLFITSSGSPTIAYNLNSLTSLIIARNAQKEFQANVITFIPDSLSRAGNVSGLILTEDWQGNSLFTPYHFGSPKKLSSGNQQANGSKQIDLLQNIQVCNEIDGYNYSTDDPSNGESWSETSCTTYGFSQPDMGPAIPPPGIVNLLGNNSLPFLEVVIQPPTNPIANISDYFKCFTNGSSPDHTYSVQVCVDQPQPGTREAWGLTPEVLGALQTQGT